jgi:hypothetical protein
VKDLHTGLEHLRAEGDDRELNAGLSADRKQRAFFAKLPVRFRASAGEGAEKELG